MKFEWLSTGECSDCIRAELVRLRPTELGVFEVVHGLVEECVVLKSTNLKEA